MLDNLYILIEDPSANPYYSTQNPALDLHKPNKALKLLYLRFYDSIAELQSSPSTDHSNLTKPLQISPKASPTPL
jgi:hypothetical protein